MAISGRTVPRISSTCPLIQPAYRTLFGEGWTNTAYGTDARVRSGTASVQFWPFPVRYDPGKFLFEIYPVHSKVPLAEPHGDRWFQVLGSGSIIDPSLSVRSRPLVSLPSNAIAVPHSFRSINSSRSGSNLMSYLWHQAAQCFGAWSISQRRHVLAPYRFIDSACIPGSGRVGSGNDINIRGQYPRL